MIQNSVVAHRLGRLDAQAVDDGADAFGRGQALEREPLDRHVIDLGLDGGGAVGVDVERTGLKCGPMRASLRIAARALSRKSLVLASSVITASQRQAAFINIFLE